MIVRRSFLSFVTVFIFVMITQINVTIASASESETVSVAELLRPGKVKDRFEGDVDAPVTIIEYASLTCVHCANFYNEILPEIRKKYIKTGKVKLIFREFAYDPRATAGFMLARCVPEDRYFPLLDVLFKKQPEWAWQQDALTPLKKIGLMAGLTDESFKACLTNQSILDEVNASFQRGQELGVHVTPTFFINGKKYEGVESVETFFSIIDGLL
ncbi:DsbA family protein [Bartonella sp. F02]|uniref:DsbA family protein n=1 Tax=Bartonella sp. F02 TaxID=2967262 RepID=UPI0022A8EE7A|nr:DsbA family protein [Bartonella sp. F02]MCZ2328488.1 DsbA family protein [Bartonella sp. F02]